MKPLWEMDVDFPGYESASSTLPESNPYIDWAWSILCWDGFVPVVIFTAPAVTELLFPQNDGLLILLNVFLPIIAFFVRLAIGNQRFEREQQYSWQVALFFVAVFFLIFLDAMLILFHSLRGGITSDGWHVLIGSYVIYLTAMAVAFFPFRRRLALRSEPAERDDMRKEP